MSSPSPDPPSDGGDGTSQPESAPQIAPSSKRHRRPSVRLGDIGDHHPTTVSDHRRPKHHKPPSTSAKNRSGADVSVPQDSGGRDDKMRRLGGPISRLVRTNWFSPKVDEVVDEERDDLDVRSRDGGGGGMEGVVGDEGDNYREFDEELVREDSLSPRKDHQSRVRVSDAQNVGVGRRAAENVELDALEWDGNGEVGGSGGVGAWLNRLGLGRYAPVFQVHEVDEEVLPLLTLEDLKEMGINAVGSRRKMFSAIEKLHKNYT